jgi:Undecaprenyl-phosphate galactose phosphotransferase WbaP
MPGSHFLISNLRNLFKIIVLFCLDVSAFYSSLFVAFYVRKILNHFFSGLSPQLSLSFFLHIWWLPVIFISFIIYERLYINKLPFWDETKELLKAIFASTIAILAIITLGNMSGKISRLTILFLWISGLFFFPLFRLIGKKTLHALGLWSESVIIIGAGSAGVETAKGINADIHLGYHVIGFLDDDDTIGKDVLINGVSYKVFGKIKHFRKFVKLLNISTVIIAIPSLSVEKLSELTNEIQKYTKSVLLVPDVKGIALTNTELYHLFMEQLFLLKINNNLKSPVNRFIKRTFDLSLSVVLLPMLLPIIALISLLIILDSRGPAFHIEDRFGKNRSYFKCVKFRTMYLRHDKLLKAYLASHPEMAVEWQAYKKLKGYDPRVTRIGSLLRKFSLDELPQIFNVLIGEMSLVGSRPYLPREENDMKQHIDTILLTPPGITGLWQVSGRNKLTFDARLRLDAWYVLNWSLWLDIVILFKTIRVVLKKEGAY